MASKKHKPQSLQKRLWRLGYARSSFDHVYNTCDYILQTPISVESPIYYPLVAAIYTLPRGICQSLSLVLCQAART
ncbi:MAG: hypothetical protein Udaeo2_13380 [Candidatus Udaeobacter sp.]|nr:MAG: hypothetical protein Udaeo2_13380 [Candidatus Udaeobacter sp.]